MSLTERPRQYHGCILELPPNWCNTDERKQELRALLDTKLSYSEIGHQFGVSRHAVAGMVYRLGWSKPRKEARAEQARKQKSKKFAKPKPSELPPPIGAAARSFNDVSGPAYGVVELYRGACRWPISNPDERDFCFCAAPQYLWYSYCVEHCRASYNDFKCQS